MNNQTISIVVAAYNVDKYLDRCVESIIKQTYSNLEIILVDDGSTDKTPQIVDKWAGIDSRVIAIHKANGGLSDARNAGIRKSKGKWIGFIDGDDYIMPDMYEQLYRSRCEGGITVCGYFLEENNIRILCPAINGSTKSCEAVRLYIDNELSCHLNGKFTYFGSYAWNKLYDRNLFTSIAYPLGKKYEDMYVIFPLLLAAREIRFISYSGYIYVQNQGSITHSKDIVQDSLEARILQDQQLMQFWGIHDCRMKELIACEYFLILYRYSFLSCAEQSKEKITADRAWNNLKKLGYNNFPAKMKVKLFLFAYFPGVTRYLRNIFKR